MPVRAAGVALRVAFTAVIVYLVIASLAVDPSFPRAIAERFGLGLGQDVPAVFRYITLPMIGLVVAAAAWWWSGWLGGRVRSRLQQVPTYWWPTWLAVCAITTTLVMTHLVHPPGL